MSEAVGSDEQLKVVMKKQLKVVMKKFATITHPNLISNFEVYSNTPDFVDLQTQGEQLIQSAGLLNQEFVLFFDKTRLSNTNTIGVLDQAKSKVRGRVSVLLRFLTDSVPPSGGSSETPTGESPDTAASRAEGTARALAAAAPGASRERPLTPPTASPMSVPRLHGGSSNLQRISSGGGVLVVVDGNIASGKTTLMDHLQWIHGTSSRMLLARESIDKWRDQLEEFYMALMYSGEHDRKERAVTQLEDTIFRHHMEGCKYRAEPVLSERGPTATVHVFSYVLNKMRLLPDGKYGELLDRYNEFMEDLRHHPTVTIYCRISKELAKDRIEKRAKNESREFEAGMSLEYLEAIGKRYDEIYPESSDTVIRVDSDQPPEEIVAQVTGQLPAKLEGAIDKTKKHWIGEVMDCFRDSRVANT